MNKKIIITISGIVAMVLLGLTIFSTTMTKVVDLTAVAKPVTKTEGLLLSQTYSSSKYGFVLKYPANYKIFDLVNQLPGIDVFQEGQKEIFTALHYESLADMPTSIYPNLRTFEDLKKDTQYQKIKEIRFLGHKALMATTVDLSNGKTDTVILIDQEKDNSVYQVIYSDVEAVAVSNQILGTFQLLE